MQKEESIRMEENKKEEMKRLDKSYQNAMDKLSQQSNASFAGVLQSNTQLQRTQEVVMATLLAQQQQQSDFMRQALQSAQQAPSVLAVEQHGKPKALESPQNDDGEQK